MWDCTFAHLGEPSAAKPAVLAMGVSRIEEGSVAEQRSRLRSSSLSAFPLQLGSTVVTSDEVGIVSHATTAAAKLYNG